MVSTLVNIPGYKVSEELYNGSRTIVYRGYRETDSLPVVIKLLKNPHPSFGELLSFRNQYTIAKNLNSPLIVQTYSLEPYQNGYALVMEDFGGISLKEWGIKGRGKSLQEFLEIAIALCNTLDILYHERIIHKDIKPSNILINPETKQVKLIDFSIASLLPRETQTLVNPNILEGTLAYISPEQTGRMNRGIDYRTDFYSLGVTFYELLTGNLPFASNEPMELVHCHIAKLPQILKNREDIPQVICDIVMKLMAKNAEDRYQSALGLKFDLEKCLSQLQVYSKNEYFEIAQRDVCDRFIIPDKLYGRETEILTLLQAFERVSLGATEMMLVAGFSGIGKTAVVNEVHKPIVRQRGYFIKGKYDQFQRNIPFSAFVQAFRDLMGQLLTESDAQIQEWKSNILDVVGENGQVIIEVIPELSRIIGEQPPAIQLSGTAAQNRFNLLFQQFTQVFTSVEHPLVMFLDDLQWADSASLKLMQLLMADTKHLLLIGAYRDNEVNPAHSLMLALSEIKKNKATINTITLVPLSQLKVNQLVGDTLKCAETSAWTLSQLIYQKTQGNPFFAIQFLKALHQENLIQFDIELGCWQCDITQVMTQAVTDDVVAFMGFQLRKLALSTQQMLQLAACIGNQFDLASLAIVSKQSQIETAAALWKALQEGLILPNGDVYKFYQQESLVIGHLSLDKSEQMTNDQGQMTVSYRFLHDRVQQAAYSLIPDDQKQLTHLKIGQLLLSVMSETEKEEKIFEIVNQLNKGADLIVVETEREELAKLNLVAAQRAKSATAYVAAIEYATKGIQLLPTSCWQQCYELTLALHDLAAEVACLSGDFRQMEQIVDEVVQNARQLLDKVKVYEVRILAEVAQSQQPKAIKTALSTLELFGVLFPEPTDADITESLQQTQDVLKGQHLEDFLELPEMTDLQALATIRILAAVTAAVYQAVPELLPLIVCKQIRLSVEYGNAAVSAQAYAWYGVILCVIGEIDLGDRIGELAMGLLSRFQSREFKASTINMVYPFVKPWKHHIQNSLAPLLDGYHSGLEMGTLEYAAYCAYNYCSLSFFLGKDLSILEPEMKVYNQALAQLKQEVAHNYLRVFYQSVLNLLAESKCPWEIQGVIYDEQIMLPLHQQANDLYAMGTLYINKLILCYLFNEWEQAIKVAADAKQYLSGVSGCFMVPVFHFYDSLTHLAMLPNAQGKECLPQQVVDNQKKLEQWANHAPTNHLHKFYLVEAEQYRVLGQMYEAMDYYDRAIASAKENTYIQEEALANELAGKFYFNWGKEKLAQAYMQQAYYSYARWGAKAKVADLERRYPQLLAPILQHTHTPFSTSETIFSLASVTPTNSGTSHSSSVSVALDLAAILKASHTLSGEIEFEKLLSSLLEIVIENAGADKCVFMLLRNDSLGDTKGERLLIKGSITVGMQPVVLQRLLVEDSQDIPLKLIYKVKHDRQTAVILDASADPTLANDPYIMRQQPKSILCSPILHQGKLMGILYLENNLATGAFTKDRVELLNLLCTQAAISLENARLYERSLEYAQQLERSLEELSAAQSVFQASQQKLQLLVQQTPLAVIEWDTNYHVTDWNPGAERIFGYSKQEALGCGFKFIIPEIIQAEMERVSVEIISQEGGNYSINENMTKDGKIIICAWYNNPLVNADGESIGVASLADDITEQQVALRDRKVAEVQLQQKAQELETALQNLQQAQLQMVQTEKMSALGNLVAGVAHEMNNPLGFIAASLKQAKPTIADIVEHLRLYQESLPNKSDEIEDHAEEIDLDYSLEDLPKMIDSMSMACDRLKNISTSLRTFSRADQDYKVPFNIHEGIDSTILILKHRLKANEQRPAIQVVANYGNLPQVECFPGQLNQVFMNIFANAIDALDESNHGLSFEEIKANPNCITITTSVENNLIKVSITDNGKGMNESVKQKIFDHLFTTKAVGKGTGLGLAIARQIVEETHGGKLSFNSVLSQGTEFTIEIPV
ncbi:MAG: AAA family ATPase [Nostoc sp. DedQUE05]|uniref:trifunctional serine/threonine-protein kinase/ATP-binding protein/sensor histidine kinase n=1 Tax=Nostoc sp. DedQUE05 TaxID=3075391 RepID=UPI002AD31E24|nr:AAA family ATPase [Nostoc sp. DedQUE05]MDZ8093747.1 AAA family ATPase [Nostoc sp. DedQUE05]